MTPTVEILYITWNRLPYTKVTLPIVLDHGGDVDYRVVIVDNGSTDGTIEYLNALEHPRISRVVLNGENLGISPVTNDFWAASSAEYLGKVDNDILLPDRWLEPIMRVHGAHDPAVGVVGLTHFDRREIDELDADDIAHNIKTLTNGVQVFLQDHIGGACYAFPRRLYEAFGTVGQRSGDLRSGWPEKQREFYLNGHFSCYVFPWVTCVHMGDPARPELPNIDPPETPEQSAARRRRHQALLVAAEPGRAWAARTRQSPTRSPESRLTTQVPLPASDGPFVSVVLTSFNYARYLRNAIESVMTQTYQHFELIIVDDASTDESPAIIEEYARRYPDRIRVIQRQENLGVSRSYNQALEHVSGAIFAGISSDDVWPPTAIETWVRFFDSHPEVDLLATDFDVIGPDGAVHTGQAKLEICPQFKRYFEADFKNLYDQLLRGNFLPDVAVVASLRQITKDELRYDELCPLLSDWELYLRMAKSYRWEYLPEPTALYRWHGQNMSAPQKSIERRGDVLGQHAYVLGKELVATRAPERRKVILEQIGRFWRDYSAMLDPGLALETQRLSAAANEQEHLRQRVVDLEEQRARQQARAEALEEHTHSLNDRNSLLNDQARLLSERVRELESAMAHPPGLLQRWLAPVRHRRSSGLFDHHGLFDAAWYVAAYPDVKTSGIDPFEHYVRFGAAEGRDPGPEFDTDFYLAKYPDVAAAGLNPLEHFVKFGMLEGRQRSPGNPTD